MTLQRSWLFIGWLLILGVFYGSLMPHPPQPLEFHAVDKVEHTLAYATLMWWFCQVYRVQRLRLFFAFASMGIGIEYLQGLTTYRTFDYADMLANASGALVGWAIAALLFGNTLIILNKLCKKIPQSSL